MNSLELAGILSLAPEEKKLIQKIEAVALMTDDELRLAMGRRDDEQKQLLALQERRSRRAQADLSHDFSTESRQYPTSTSYHND